jgi:hypothetical protein
MVAGLAGRMEAMSMTSVPAAMACAVPRSNSTSPTTAPFSSR